MEISILSDYLATKEAIDLLTTELNEQKSKVILYLKAQAEHKAVVPGGKFSLRETKVYEYSQALTNSGIEAMISITQYKDKIKEIDKTIVAMEKAEIKDGTAKVVDTMFTPVVTITKETLKKGGK